jgi:hypothetical protein
VSRRVSRARRSPSAHPTREMWTLRRRGSGEREGGLGADLLSIGRQDFARS